MAIGDIYIPAPPIEPDKHTAAYKIFHYPYRVMVKPIHFETEESLNVMGQVSSGFKVIDHAAMNTYAPYMIRIAMMAQMHSEGTPFRLVDPKDAVKIYQIITQHLKDHLINVNQSIHVSHVPIEELRKLDALREQIHPMSSGMAANEPLVESRLHQLLRGLGGGGLADLAGGFKERDDERAAPRPFEGLAEDVAERIHEREKPWRR